MSTSITTGMMNTPLANLSRQSDIQHIKPAAVKPTLDLKNVITWDNTISTRENAQAIKISLGDAGCLDTTKGKAWKALLTELQGSVVKERKRLEEEITACQLQNEQVHVYLRRYQNLWKVLNKAHGQWTFEYVATNYLIPGIRVDYDHIVDTTVSAATVNEKLATIA
eukprot:jgi/Tetstr1/466416/TSEL_010944.t1